MELHYVKIDKDWDDLDVGDSIIFDLPTIELKYRIPRVGEYWLHIDDYFNNKIFNELGIPMCSFVNSIVGYETTGGFSHVCTLNDLKKVIKALDDECVKKFGMPKEESIKSKEGKEIPPSELKEGDYIKIRSTIANVNFIYIVKELKDGQLFRHVGYDLDNKNLSISDKNRWNNPYENTKITYATPEEKKLLDDELLKKGYVWDNVNKKLLEVSSLNIKDKTGIVEISQEHYLNDCISRVNPIYIPSYYKCSVFVDTDKEEAKEELNLFPTKKHYQLNFNY